MGTPHADLAGDEGSDHHPQAVTAGKVPGRALQGLINCAIGGSFGVG
jgi:hypothetical protein